MGDEIALDKESELGDGSDGKDDKPSEIEARAARMGWVPEESFRGDKEKWVSAEEFVERGETQIPILKERLKKMDGQVVELRGTIGEMKRTFSEFKKWSSKTVAAQYKKAADDIIEKQRAAVADGDIDAFDKYEQKRAALEKDMQDKIDSSEADSGGDGGLHPEAIAIFDEWKEDNEWFDNDPVLRSYARARSVEIQDERGIGGKALYDAVGKDVKKKFPEKFKNSRRDDANTVVGDSDPPVKTNKRSFGNLPKEAQAQCLEFIKTIPNFTKEEYVASYDWD
jgi:hypothetical protein